MDEYEKDFIEEKKMNRQHEKDKILEKWVFEDADMNEPCPLDKLYESQFEDDEE